MSGFDLGWLDLREGADHRSLAQEPLARLVDRFGARDAVSIADLGAGSGSLLRSLAPRLGERQRWTLIDADAALLAHARLRLSAWADEAQDDGETLRLRKAGRRIEVATALCDLRADPLPAAAASADLVTAAAFFDLAGRAWTQDFVARLSAARRPLYAPLVYAGGKRFAPVHPLDEAAVGAFNRHQKRDKGLGPALGPDAAAALVEIGRAAGFAALSCESPWRLGDRDAALTRRLAADMAGAIAELDDGPELGDWLRFRLETAEGGAEVLHRDVLLAPSSG